jgi:hypothetical protein
MAEIKVENESANLTPNALNYVCIGDVTHIIGKLSTRAITLFETSFQSEFFIRCYGLPKFQKS